MSREEMFELLFAALKSKGFGGPAAHRIGVHLVETIKEEKGIDLQLGVIADVISVLEGFKQQLTEYAVNKANNILNE